MLCVCWTGNDVLHESHQFIQHGQTPIIPLCVVHNPHGWMKTPRLIVRYLWAYKGATHQQVTAILHGHPHVICKMAP